MNDFDIWLRGWIFAISLTLLVIGLISYLRVREKRIGMVTLVFALFAVKGFVLSMAIFFETFDSLLTTYLIDRVLDLFIIVFLLLAIWGVPRLDRKGD